MGINGRLYLLYLRGNFYVEGRLFLDPNPHLMGFGFGFGLHDHRGLFSELGPIWHKDQEKRNDIAAVCGGVWEPFYASPDGMNPLRTVDDSSILEISSAT